MSANDERKPSFLEGYLKLPPLFSSAIMEKLAEEPLLSESTVFTQGLTAFSAS